VTPVLGASSFQSVSMLKSHHFVRSVAVFPAQVLVAFSLEEVGVGLLELEKETDLEVLMELYDPIEFDLVSVVDVAMTPDRVVMVNFELDMVRVTDPVKRGEVDDLVGVERMVALEDKDGVAALLDLIELVLTTGVVEGVLVGVDDRVVIGILAELTIFKEVDALLYVDDLAEVCSLAVLDDLVNLDVDTLLGWAGEP